MKVLNQSWAIFARCVLAATAAWLLVACGAPPTKSAGATEAHAGGLAPEQKKRPPRAADSSDVEAVKARMEELIDLCRNDKPGEAAGYFVYRGPDKSREWKDTMRADDPLEKAGVVELCRRVNGYLDEGGSYRLGAIRVKRESEGVWHGLEVSFQKDGQTRKALFAFLKIKGKFAVGDIDD
jgi:hypothetical protein